MHQATIVVEDEVLTEPLQSLLGALVPYRMGELDHHGYQWGGGWHKHLGAAEDEAIHHTPWGTTVSDHCVMESVEVVVILEFAAQGVVELKRRAAEGAKDVIQRSRCHSIITATRHGVDDDVETAGSVLHAEIITEQFAYPLMLRNGRQPLVEQELEGVMVSAYSEMTPP